MNQTINPEQVSRFMSYVLRHHAETYKLDVDKAGYVSTEKFLKVLQKNFNTEIIDLEYLTKLVETNDKKRYSISDDKTLIRANQGHSKEVAKNLDPESLLTEIKDTSVIKCAVHGTDYKAWLLIKEMGLSKMARQFIHLAKGLPGDTGVISGMRKSCSVRIYIDLDKVLADGIKLWLSDNDVILTAGVNGILEPKYFKEVHILKKNAWVKINLLNN